MRSEGDRRRKFSVLCSFVAILAFLASSLLAQATVTKRIKIGGGLYEVVVNEPANSIYVASTAEGARNVYILDAKTLEQKGSIDVSEAPAFGLGINIKTQTLYTGNTRTGNMSVIDLKSGKVVKTMRPEGEENTRAHWVVVDELANMVYVSIPMNPGKIWVVDGSTNEIVDIIENVGNRPTGMSVDVHAKRLYASSLNSGEIIVVDLKSRKVIDKFSSAGERPHQHALDVANKRLFVTNFASGHVSVLNIENGKLIKTVKTGDGALGIGYNPNKNQLYVANRGTGQLTVVDTNSYEVIANLKSGTLPNTVAIHRELNTVYVTNKAQRRRRNRSGQAPANPPVVDEGGDTVTMITP